jgi:hypothetical protein
MDSISIVKRKEEEKWGDDRAKRVILEGWGQATVIRY